MHISAKYCRTSVVLIAIVVALMVPGTRAFASGNPNPGVLPIQSHPHGMSYAQWSARWWQWAASFPTATNPSGDDPNGTLCVNSNVHSNGFVIRNMWFLVGSFNTQSGSPPFTRSCTVPAGRTILFPTFNAEWSQAEANNQALQTPGQFCPSFAPLPPGSPTGTSDAALQACATAQANLGLQSGASFTTTVDGKLLQNLSSYRALSAPFDIGCTADNPVVPPTKVPPCPAGPNMSVADGFWIILTPLSPGTHTIEITVVIPNVFSTVVMYTLTIR